MERNNIKLLTPVVLPETLEAELQELFLFACKCSMSMRNKKDVGDENEAALFDVDEFVTLRHQGMRKAQEKIIDSILSCKDDVHLSSVRRFHSYRGIADAIGWQLLGYELAYAKRFFMANKPPDLSKVNVDSVISTVELFHSSEPDSIALITDLTNFIQVGDVYHVKKDGRANVVEVKDGKVNSEILSLLMGKPMLLDDANIMNRFPDKSNSFKRQLERTIRQKKRMQLLDDFLKNDEGVDTATGLFVKVHELPVVVDTWYKYIFELARKCKEKAYAIDVVQECLYIGCYSTNRTTLPGQFAFENWFSGMGATPGCPRTSLVNCMQDPLGLPIYCLPIPDELKFDLLFGRKHICLGIHMPSLIKICNDIGIKVRLASHKETARIKGRNKYVWKFNGQAVVIGEGEQQTYLGEGFFLRVFFHGENPVDTMIAYSINP